MHQTMASNRRTLRNRLLACALLLSASTFGLACGSSECGDTTSDSDNCGACGVVCKTGSVCSMGTCEDIAESLSGLRWNLPCTSTPGGGGCSTELPDGSNGEQIVKTTLTGTPNVSYEVTLHFTGVVEQRIYTGFKSGGAHGAEPDGGSNSDFFIHGGDTPSSDDPFNVYELEISDPPQVYYLNSGPSEPSYVWLIDYLATIPMNAGAKVTLTANPVDDSEISNQGPDGGAIVVPGVPPAPKPYDGQFVQMDVTSVTVAQ